MSNLYLERNMDQQARINELNQELAYASMMGISALADRDTLITEVNRLQRELTCLRAENEGLRSMMALGIYIRPRYDKDGFTAMQCGRMIAGGSWSHCYEMALSEVRRTKAAMQTKKENDGGIKI
jgi:PAS domain-containing protein